MIVRGTTPYHTFVLPMAVEDIDRVYVTYSQNGKVILDKTNEDLTLEDIETTIVPDTSDTESGNTDSEGTGTDAEDTGETTEIIEPEYASQVTIHLTQEDTLSFEIYPFANKNIAEVQIRVLDIHGEAYASDVVREKISNTLKDEVIAHVDE